MIQQQHTNSTSSRNPRRAYGLSFLAFLFFLLTERSCCSTSTCVQLSFLPRCAGWDDHSVLCPIAKYMDTAMHIASVARLPRIIVYDNRRYGTRCCVSNATARDAHKGSRSATRSSIGGLLHGCMHLSSIFESAQRGFAEGQYLQRFGSYLGTCEDCLRVTLHSQCRHLSDTYIDAPLSA